MSSSPAEDSPAIHPVPGRAVDATAEGAAPVEAPPAAQGGSLPHRPPEESEEVYYDGHPFMGGKVGTGVVLIFLALLLLAGPVIYWVMARRWPNLWLILICVLAGLILLAVPTVITRARRYRITNVRIDIERGIFSKTVDTLEMWHVEDLAMRQSFFERIAGIGTILVKAHDPTTGTQQLRGVRDPRKLFTTLEQRVIAVKRLAGVVKVDNG